MAELDPEAISTAIAREGIVNEGGYISDAVYDLFAQTMTFACVDVVPVNITESGLVQMGTIVRGIGPETGKIALLGGRIRKDETIPAAISRHLYDSFEDGSFDFHEGNDETTPFFVGQFMHTPPTPDHQYDPAKHTITQTYLVDIPEPKVTRDEALAFHWIGLNEVPAHEQAAYGHQISLQRAADFIRRLHPELT